jgi:hypothetical protein
VVDGGAFEVVCSSERGHAKCSLVEGPCSPHVGSYDVHVAVLPFDVVVQLLSGIAYLEGSATAQELVVVLHVSKKSCVLLLLELPADNDGDVPELATRVCQGSHGLSEDLTHSVLSRDAWNSDKFVVAIAWMVRSVGHHRNVESGVVSLEVDESLPHNGLEETRLDEVLVAITAHSIDCDALQVAEQHGFPRDLEEIANTLLGDDVRAMREEGFRKALICHFEHPAADQSHAWEVFLPCSGSNEV